VIPLRVASASKSPPKEGGHATDHCPTGGAEEREESEERQPRNERLNPGVTARKKDERDHKPKDRARDDRFPPGSGRAAADSGNRCPDCQDPYRPAQEAQNDTASEGDKNGDRRFARLWHAP